MGYNKKKLRRQIEKEKVTQKDLIRVKDEATTQAVNIMAVIPLMILRDKYGFGSKRLVRWMRYFTEIIDALFKKYVSLEDMARVIHEETGIDVSKSIDEIEAEVLEES